MSAYPGKFLTIEGIEGVGKSTAVKYIETYASEMGREVVVTREPGGSEIAEQIRKVLLTTHEEKMSADTELLLMFASRAQHIASLVRPALQQGKWVVSDRFVDASYAYQGGGREIDLDHVRMLDKWIVGNLKPDATILLDAPPDLGMRRAKKRGAQDRIEQEKVDFFERVRANYLQRAKEDPKRFHVIDATQPLSQVHNEIKQVIDKLKD